MYYYLVLPGLILIVTSCNTTSTADKKGVDKLSALTLPKPTAVSPEEAARIKNACEIWYDSVLKQKGFNGEILVAKNGNILFEQYNGTGHLPGTDTITENTPLHIASVSKTFTAMAILKLWQDGKLNIDDEFSKYFPTFNYPGVTIRSLLNHRSGLPNYTHFLENLGWDKSRFVSNEDVFNFLITRKAELIDIAAPNTHFTYCNTNYALLALLIEKISGKKYADFINQTFFIPLQMKNSYVFSLADTAKAIPSYNWKGKIEPLGFLDLVYGDKNIYTTVRDLLIWDRVLSTNLLFTKETLEQAYAPYSNEKPGTRNYGLGWRMYIYPTGKKIIYHNGWWHGSNASFKRLLNDSATIIVIGNKFTRAIYHTKILASIFDSDYGPAEEEETETLKDLTAINDPVSKTGSLKTKNNLKSGKVTVTKSLKQHKKKN
ncbi:MAG: serine hydrolase domain-containing protein [Ferruginibacter sp.]